MRTINDAVNRTFPDSVMIFDKNPNFGKVCLECGTLDIQGHEIVKGNYQIDSLVQMGLDVTHGVLSVDCAKKMYRRCLNKEPTKLPENLRAYCKGAQRM